MTDTTDILPVGRPFRERLPAPELLNTGSPPGLEPVQITTDPRFTSHVFYDPGTGFDPTGRFMLINREGHGVRRLLLCDLAEDFLLTPVTPEPAYGGAAMSPDGRHIYYSLTAPGVVTIRRIALADLAVETFLVLEGKLSDSGARMSPQARNGNFSLSHDGQRIGVAFDTDAVPYRRSGLAMFDTSSGAALGDFVLDDTYKGAGSYAPCTGPDGRHLLLASHVYERTRVDADGRWHREPLDDKGGAFELIDEQGRPVMEYPVGRDRPHQNIGHAAPFGRTLGMIFHVDCFDTAPHYRSCIMFAEPVPIDGTPTGLGRHMDGGQQIDMTRHITRPDVCHLRTDPAARYMVCDGVGYGDRGMESQVYIGTIDPHPADGLGPAALMTTLIHPKSTWQPYWCECMPSFSPDLQWIVFNSDYPNVNHYKGARHTPQAFAVRGFSLV